MSHVRRPVFNAGGIFPRHLCGVPFVYHTKRRATAPDGENGARENENKTTYKSMTIEKNDITMKKTLLILSALLLTAATSLRADGGMWMLGNLTKQTYDAMRAYGFSMTPEELSNDNGTSLRNAVVLFGGYCSGVVVSDNGLVFTNHHCGFESIQKHSTPEHDYVKDGFYAATPEEEWNVPGLFVSFPLREERVTDRVLPVITEKGADGAQHQIWGDRRNQLLDSMETVLVKEVTAKDSTLWAELVPYYGANEFYVTVYRVYPDVRLVLAPPSSLGKFGGDTDNWVWPRETCDFSVFRIYAGKDNMPAPYSKDNVPYKPSRVAAVSLDGYKAGDFAMTLGFPGSTYRYLSSYGIEARMNAMNDEFIKAGSLRLPMWKAEMDADPALRLKYDSKYQTFSNTYKNSIGMNRSITMYGILDSKRKFEQSLTEWINADPQRKEKYGDVLENLRQAYPDYTLKRKQLYKSILNLNYDLQVFELVAAISHGDYSKEKGMRDELIAAVREIYRNLDFRLDLRTLAAGLWMFRDEMPADTYPGFFSTVDKQYGGNFGAYLTDVAARSSLTDSTAVIGRLKRGKTKWIERDPLRKTLKQISSSLVKIQESIDPAAVNEGERRLTQAVREMYEGSPLYSDANMTLRMSYGTFKTYTPWGGSEYPLYTTPQTLAAKVAKAAQNKDYYMEDNVLRLMTSGDYGRYTDSRSKNLQLCFVTDNDITGGNSGSPMFNGKGELVGLAFDGNWESMANDLQYSTELTRCIGVDIRYVMYVIDRWAKADRLMKEISLAR